MNGRLQGKVAIVTGASSGIGRAIAILFAKEGARVVCADINQHPGSENGENSTPISTHQYIQNEGGVALWYSCDVGCSADVERVVRIAVEEYDRLDIMVNNAGIGVQIPAPIWEASESLYDQTHRTNAKGVFLGCKFAAAQMLRQELQNRNGDRGWIINIASVLGLVGQENASMYCSSKGSVVNLTRAVAMDCAPYRVHVNAICPGYTNTPMVEELLRDSEISHDLRLLHPFRGVGVPDDIARAALFLASEDASWISGAIIPVDGGYTAR